ncbi:polysialyltransferase family glycosyltransferase [Pararhizobium sp. YC-54]|uniref:polysialyltransferase family glycosyltransferase n=1 Tax=Pararhizobium sp. YC-54 TaxID=2986920 RepID=UPI0021F77BB6|nr:polysialyltransferase family glycosyltransferase [Pararhizobium sp. YC-54]MCV9998943.1 polysialyltransferase family glycosyltransferase [Pararhizobium sp. YC-54]
MKRLILATGKWSTILSVAYIESRWEQGECEDTLLHISHVCNQSYLDSFDEFSSKFADFQNIFCINYCVYENSTPENYTNGDLAEKSDAESEALIRGLLGDVDFDEIIVPHLFSSKSRLLLSMYPNAQAYCIEEGLNSYFRHHNKKNLNTNEEYFLSRLDGYVSFNFMGLPPLFDYQAHDVPVIVPDPKYLRTAIEKIPIDGHLIEDGSDKNKVLFIGQFARADMSMDNLLNHYLSSISSILLSGFSVYFVKHPRDISILPDLLTEAFVGQKFHIVDAHNVPVERIASSYEWCAVFSYASSALVTIPTLYGIPAFTIDEYDLKKLTPGDGDFGNARNFCAVVIPTLRSLLRRLQANEDKPEEVAREVFSSFKPQRDLLKRIYAQKPPALDLEGAMKLPLRAIQRRIQQRPFNSVLRLAGAQKEEKFGLSVKSAWHGLALNPYRPAAYSILVSTLLKPIRRWFNPTIPNNEADILRIAEAKPLSIPALAGNARLFEKKADFKKALDYWLIMLFTHPLHPRSYYNLANWAYKKWSQEIRAKRSGYLFDALFNRSLRQVGRKARSIKADSSLNGTSIAALAYRPNRGATGGPGGVLWLQKALLGPYFHERSIDYHFREKHVYPDWYGDLASGASFALDICKTGRYGHYFTHDLGCAYGLALAGKSYVLDWHFQGSFVTQMLNFGHQLQPSLIKRLKAVEAVAMKKAKYVVFPSDGARDMYFSDEYRGANLDEVSIGPSIYNTILPGAARPDLANLKIPAFDGLTFTSVGTLTAAKGQDRVLEFFERMMPVTQTRVRWICIGDGVMRDDILLRAKNISKKHDNFEFTYLKKIPHKEVMNALHVSDVYIMLHRISIFDFATLEAMKNNCAIVLSKVGGNIDFNKADNVIFSEDITFPNDDIFSVKNISRLKKLNTDVLNKHFSVQNFKKQNFELLEKLVSD